MKAIQRVEREHLKKIPEFRVGDTVRVHVQVIEGDKVRAQVFQGTVLARSGGGLRETFTVRKVSGGVAVERIFPLHSPGVVKIERTREGNVRRAKLTYMRARKGKAARITGRDVSQAVIAEEAARLEAEAAAEAAARAPQVTPEAADKPAEVAAAE